MKNPPPAGNENIVTQDSGKKVYLCLLLTTCLILAACSNSKPKVKAVKLTEPWISLNLSCQGGGVVVLSNEQKLNCAYGGENSRDQVTRAIAPYAEFFKRNDWTATSESSDGTVCYLFEKDGKQLFLTSIAPSVITSDGMHDWQGFGIQIEIWAKK